MAEYSHKSDLPVEAARKGCDQACDALIRRFQLPLFAYVSELIGNQSIALDLVQDTLVKAVKNINGLRNDQRIGSWLFGIAHQCCIDHWRKSGRQSKVFEPIIESTSAEAMDLSNGPCESLIQNEIHQEILDHLNNLSTEHRTVVLLHYLEDFSLAEISNITGTGIGTVKSRLHYAKKAMNSKLTHLKI